MLKLEDSTDKIANSPVFIFSLGMQYAGVDLMANVLDLMALYDSIEGTSRQGLVVAIELACDMRLPVGAGSRPDGGATIMNCQCISLNLAPRSPRVPVTTHGQHLLPGTLLHEVLFHAHLHLCLSPVPAVTH